MRYKVVKFRDFTFPSNFKVLYLLYYYIRRYKVVKSSIIRVAILVQWYEFKVGLDNSRVSEILGKKSTFHLVSRGSVYREVPKSCCGLLSPAAVSLRWLMLLLLTVGVCCALVGTVLGATRATAPHHLTVALLMIGVGIVLVTVSGVAWRLMSHEAPPWRSMFGFSSGSESADPNRRFLPRLPPSYGRPHHPYAAMMYPEFQYRAPPPSYQASMQEYRLRLLLLDRHNAASPPPTYRSHPATLLRRGGLMVSGGGEYSRPPSYRSRTSSVRPETVRTDHSRQASSVHSVSLKETEATKENVVTIVQTGEQPTGPVIVTISGPPEPLVHHPPPPPDHMQILAHL
uniref:Uncharacterized protein n=1 Tax=Rhodnius prolixus TaxID=13249 RepID=T1HCW2_RHOPR